GGLSYAFGAPVLLLYSNVIFLVGAAWVPWGLCALDRLLRQGRRRGVVELAAVLALQVLGGDPEAAYLPAACGARYAAVPAGCAATGPRPLLTWPRAVGAVGFWVAATLGLASARTVRPRFLATNGLVLAAWVAAGLAIAWRWHRRPGAGRLAPMLAGWAAACTLATAVAAVQILPALELAGQRQRVVGDAPTQLCHFSLAPSRLAELIWPNVFGISCPENRSWLQAAPPAGDHEVWQMSLYMGSLTIALAWGAAVGRGGPPWRAWLTIVASVGLLAGLGKYGGPLWWARWGPWASLLGPHDPVHGQ